MGKLDEELRDVGRELRTGLGQSVRLYLLDWPLSLMVLATVAYRAYGAMRPAEGANGMWFILAAVAALAIGCFASAVSAWWLGMMTTPPSGRWSRRLAVLAAILLLWVLG